MVVPTLGAGAVVHHGLLRAGPSVTLLRRRHGRQGVHDRVDRLAVIGQVFSVANYGWILSNLVQPANTRGISDTNTTLASKLTGSTSLTLCTDGQII